jgi:hypothetical protein
MLVEWAEGLAMNTFLAQTLCESTITEDRSRFEMTFVDAGGQRHKISIPFTIAADLIPVLESVAADCNAEKGDLTRLPRAFAVGRAVAERMVLLRFDQEAPYAIGVEVAEALSRELQEQSEQVSLMRRPALH